LVNAGKGGVLPPIEKLGVRTDLQLRSGETVVLGGLVGVRTESVGVAAAWFGELPLIGTFFKYMTEQQDRIQTLVLVRAEIMPPGAAKPSSADGRVKSLSEPQAVADDETRAVQPVRYDAPPTIAPSANPVIRR
jgi:type II secretory pathway component GspD/PulD (secretin)